MIAVINVVIIFLLLTLFSQKALLLYPGFYILGVSELVRSVSVTGNFQIIIPRIIFAQSLEAV